MQFLYLSMITLAAASVLINARTFDQCSLARELYRQGFPYEELPDWDCLVQAESSYRTHVIGPQNTDGSYDHGLFQINDRYWCSTSSYPGGGCHVRCKDLRTDDITDASRCAKKIFKVHGFSAWEGWKKRCRGRSLPSLDHCFECRSAY